MRVSLLTYSTRPRGGVVHTLALAEALAGAGAEVEVWTLARGGDGGFFRPVDPVVRVRAVELAEVPGESVGDRIVRSIDVLAAGLRSGLQPGGIVHAQDCISTNAVIAAGRECLRTVHHLDDFTTEQLRRCHERAIVEPVAHVCVSAAVAAELAAGWGITATVIANGVDAPAFAAAASADPTAAAARRHWQDEFGRYVLSVGGIEPRKGTADLVEAIALLRRRDPTVAWVVAGGETLFDYRDYRDRVLARASELGVAPVLLGTVAQDDLPGLVAGAAAFAFPSTKEGFGMAAMEALAAGIPLVTRDLPVLREVFDGAADFATDPPGFADALARALRHPDPGRAARGRELAAAHTWTAAAAAHLDFYSGLSPSGFAGAARTG
jgi:glycosyltransferase-like protein